MSFARIVRGVEVDVREMRDRLYTAFMEKSGRASDNMARRVCEEFGLADLGLGFTTKALRFKGQKGTRNPFDGSM